MVVSRPAARAAVRPGAAFFVLLGLTVATGWAAWAQLGTWVVFAFVVVGWVLSLTLHEFAHAVVAYMSGDHGVVEKGYLTLDPRRYAEPGLSLVLPLIFVVMGGIGLPGGAVWINQSALRSPAHRTAVSLAGPAANVVMAAICLVPLGLEWFDPRAQPVFAAALGFLGFLQVTAVVLNLLPIPGLDGYGAIEPHLSLAARRKMAPVRQYGFLVLIGLLWFVDPVNEAFWDAIFALTGFFGVDDFYPAVGSDWFRFWQDQFIPIPT